MTVQRPLELFEPEQIWKRSLLAKIEGLVPWQVFDHLSRCGVEELYRTCRCCGDWRTFYYRCSMKFCPLCNWRISRERSRVLKVWCLQVKQPKHLVLTRRNHTGVLTRSLFRSTMRAFAKLRRTKIFREVKGGCVSMELTNEGKGWHVHLHILCDVRWLEMATISVEWGKLMKQDFAIVKVKDLRQGGDYLHEVTKYVVEGSELAGWKPEEIAQFVHAIRGIKFFSTFGSLFKVRREIREFLEATKAPKQVCQCGSSDFVFESEESAITEEIRRRSR